MLNCSTECRAIRARAVGAHTLSPWSQGLSPQITCPACFVLTPGMFNGKFSFLPSSNSTATRQQLDKYLKKRWIHPSCSPYGAPIVFIWKKTGELRMTVDYRALNRQTKKDVYPLPRINDLLDKLSKVHFLSAIDLASGYH